MVVQFVLGVTLRKMEKVLSPRVSMNHLFSYFLIHMLGIHCLGVKESFTLMLCRHLNKNLQILKIAS